MKDQSIIVSAVTPQCFPSYYKSSASETQNLRVRNTLNAPFLVNNEELNSNAFSLSSRGLNIGHLNISGHLWGKTVKILRIKSFDDITRKHQFAYFGFKKRQS